jgi:hypothetical protein
MKRVSFVSFVFVALSIFSSVALAASPNFTLSFDPKDLIFEKVEGYNRVKMEGTRFSAEPGNPLLPIKFVQIAIPGDVEAESVEVISFQRQELSGTYKIYPSQPPLPLSDLPTKGKEISFVPPNSSIYNLSSEYPGILAKVTNNGFFGGQHIAGVALYPLRYIPSEGEIILYTRIEFKLVFKPTSHLPAPVNRRSQRGTNFYSDLIKSMVVNPEEVQLETKGFLPPEEEVDYLIITDGSLVSTFQPLADWKIQKGIPTEIKEVSGVIANYPGYDNQEKIRNCIRDYYANHGTKWVLLGGDTPILPHRMAEVMDTYIPCDLYYSDLDSNWDADGDHVYGEYPDSVDMYPDVFVGRAPSSNVTQAQTFVNKCLTYETNPPTDYQRRILYAAEMLWAGTDASELKNYIDSSFVPDYFQKTKLYETSGNLNWTNFRAGLNLGQNFINHSGHGNYDRLSIGIDLWTSSDMDNLTNAPRFSLFYTFGCITAAIDMDCIGEHFINNPNGGGFAYCGNTRYGWGIMGEPLRGPGAEFDIEFFRALFPGKNYQIGKTLGNSKIPFVPISQDEWGYGPYYRWTMFTLLLLGDPTLDLWMDIPTQFSVSHDSVFFAGMNYFVVNVVQDSALVCCFKDGEILGTAYSSGGSAVVYFGSPLFDPGTMHVTVTKHNFVPYRDTVVVIPSAGPYVIYHSHQIDDSPANNNGVVNPGETIWMPVTVKNIGMESAHGVSAKLRENDDYVTVTDSAKSFGDIASGMTAVSLGDYVFQVDPFCPDSHRVWFTLQVTCTEGSWASIFFEMVVEPDFIITSIPDTAVVQPGDSTKTKLILTSIGGFNWQVNLTHTVLPPEVSGFLQPAQLIPTDSSFFKIYTTPWVSPGIYPLTVTATGGGINREKEMVLGVAAPPYYGPVWHVSPAGHDAVGNGSMEFPFRTIQKGINSATAGDTVLVERGRYVENINFSGKAILVTSRFIFDGSESTIESTIIDGNYAGSVVTFNSGENSNSVIRGFTITRGYFSYGAGIRCYESSPTIMENFVERDSFNLDISAQGGVGIYCWASHAKIYRNLFADNKGLATVFLYGGSNAQLINNTICDNYWGALSVQSSSAYIKNNIFYNNARYAIHTSNSQWNVSYNDAYGHADNYYGSISDQTGINGNISADPLFADPFGGDYHLTQTSPCINAGDPADSVPPGGGTRIDMGAFESQFTGPWLTYYSHQIDDSGENNNGVVNPGETISMPITIINYGTETCYGVSGTLRTADAFTVVTDSIKNFGDIPPGMTGVSMGAYSFEVNPSCPDSHQVKFALELTDVSSTRISYFYVMVTDTDFAITCDRSSVSVASGDSTHFNLTVTSLGGFRSQVDLTFSALPPGISGILNPDHLVPTDSSVFRVYIAPDVSNGVYPITITASGGGITHERELECAVLTCGDVNGNKAVEMGDVVYIINYLFKGGPPPSPLQSADVNADGDVDLGDLVYLIVYLYRGGQPPHC